MRTWSTDLCDTVQFDAKIRTLRRNALYPCAGNPHIYSRENLGLEDDYKRVNSEGLDGNQ